jgi:hypothetical protein
MVNSSTAKHTPTEATIPGLADIQEPLLANDWYMAPGWIVMLGLLMFGFCYLGYRYWRHYQHQKPVKFALLALSKLDLEASGSVEQITQLIKRLLLTRVSAHPAIALSGSAWQAFLMTSLPTSVCSKLSDDPLPDLQALHYQRSPAKEDIQRYANFAAVWMKSVKDIPATARLVGASHA